MNRTVPAALICAATMLATACASTAGTTTPAAASTAACAAALNSYVKQAEANPNGPSMGKPAACNGLPDAVVEQLGEQALAKMWGDMASATAFPTDLLPSDLPSMPAFPTDLPTSFPTSG
jgi:hypothetical protein